MKPAPFTLHCPQSLRDALDLLSKLPSARVIAGGQSLMPMLNMRLTDVEHVISINAVKTLSGIWTEGDAVVLGAMTRQREVELSDVVRDKLPLLAEAILQTGHRQTRNRGTIGGSLCNLDPSAEQVAVALAMDADLLVEKSGAQRHVSAEAFALDVMTTCLEPDEMLTQIRITPWSDVHGFSFLEYARRHGDYAVASAAVLLEQDAAGLVTRASLTLGGVAGVPVRLTEAEHLLVGEVPTAQAIEAAAALAARVDAQSDATYPAWYRQRLARTMLARAIVIAAERGSARRERERDNV